VPIVKRRRVMFLTAALAAVLALVAAPAPQTFRFVILGDRTGEAIPGVYEQIWREAAAENPAFVLTVGDTIEGLNDATAESEWQEVQQILQPFRRYPIYLAPGNHDIWSPLSERLFRKYATHAPHYSFDYAQAHFTVFDNSRSEDLSADELRFLETDLAQHAAQPLKFIVSHRPSWLIDAALGNPNFPLHQLAKKYGVKVVLAGHVHQMLHTDLEGVTYISAPSSGGHLRLSARYEDGWFFGHMLADVRGATVSLHIEEARPPHGQGRITRLEDWGITGLRAAAASPPRAALRKSDPAF
jgi:Calcineurin-like phosphoesterase